MISQVLKRATLLSALTLTGCASVWNVGDDTFSCQGMPTDSPEAAECLSAREAYYATNDGAVPNPVIKKQKQGDSNNQQGQNAITQHQMVNDQIVKDYVTPNLPDRPVPVRTPAKVMRIWVSPWEDEQGDLNTVGYIYTEIEPRRWVIGDRAEYAQAALYPLQAPMQKIETNNNNQPRQEPRQNMSIEQ